jgi:hypothetical protein
MSDASDTVDPKKIRIGLAMVTVIFVISIVLFVVVDDTLAKGIFFAVALVSLVRVGLLVRWIRRRNADAGSVG